MWCMYTLLMLLHFLRTCFSERSTPILSRIIRPVSAGITGIVCMLMTWSMLYLFFDMTPGSHLGAVVLLVSCSWVCGKIAGLLSLPPLLGMLLAGATLRNTGYYDLSNSFQPHIINLRSVLTPPPLSRIKRIVKK